MCISHLIPRGQKPGEVHRLLTWTHGFVCICSLETAKRDKRGRSNSGVTTTTTEKKEDANYGMRTSFNEYPQM
jgi:hypothetical protein